MSVQYNQGHKTSPKQPYRSSQSFIKLPGVYLLTLTILLKMMNAALNFINMSLLVSVKQLLGPFLFSQITSKSLRGLSCCNIHFYHNDAPVRWSERQVLPVSPLFLLNDASV